MLEHIKHTQVGKYNRAETEEEKISIECDPLIIFKTAVENVKPLLLTQRIVKGGTAYRVSLVYTYGMSCQAQPSLPVIYIY